MEYSGGGMLLLNHASVDEAQVPTTYNPHELAHYWRHRPEAVAVRLQQILGVCGELLPTLTWDLVNGNLEDKARQAQYSGVLTQMLIKLGPAFIKFGQTLSARADLFSDEVLQELRMLCYMVPSFSTDQALELIEQELGAPLHELYDGFVPEPVAAASLGQVYKARIRATGATVAVKVL
jgi:aarF domain-containing kinase